MLSALQDMRVLKLKRDRKTSDFYYKQWGIDLEDYAYTLEANKIEN